MTVEPKHPSPGAAGHPHSRWHRLMPLFGAAMFAVALGVLYREISHFSFHDLRQYLASLPRSRLAAALACTAGSYLFLMGYDWIGLRYLGRRLPLRQVALTSFIAYAFSMNIGTTALSGGAVRLRLYSAAGLSAGEISRLIAFCIAAGMSGHFMLCGTLLVAHPIPLPASFPIPGGRLWILGLLMLLPPALFLGVSMFRRSPVQFRSWRIPLPAPFVTFPALGVSIADWILTAAALYALLPVSPDLGFLSVLTIILLAQMAGVASSVPGGLGVFESVFVLLMPDSVPHPAVLGALVAYRLIYYLTPFLTALALLGWFETRSHRIEWAKRSDFALRVLKAIIPRSLAATTFVAGFILLVSGATPGVHSRLGQLERLLPLPALELSHFLGSLTGVALLILSRGIARRVDAAWHAVTVLLGLGTVFSVVKGLDYEEAAILLVILAAFLPCRKHFSRRASVIHMRFTASWWIAVFGVLAGTAWLGFFSYRHVDFSSSLWWEFALRGDAPRFLRATTGVAAAALFFFLFQLLRSAPPKPQPPDADTLARIDRIVAASPDTTATLAWLGDKRFLFSEPGNAFLMFGIQGNSWIVMGDPIGPETEWEDLIWDFRERCDAHGGAPGFYQVGANHTHYYIDLGLTLTKLGEEGRIPLEEFSLEGSARKNLRHTKSKLERAGCAFKMLSREEAAPRLDAFRAISDAWLADKDASEKGFSLAFFDEQYLRHFSFAVVEAGGKIVAFANVLQSANREEVSVDLMRYRPDAPYGVMEFLFVELILWSVAERYRWFDLGMAPLSGLENRSLAPFWHRVGATIFRHGEHFYNFEGLRAYKEKFDPVWEGRYLASPGGFGLGQARLLLDASLLIGMGEKGLLPRL